jgi:hypothetical protein
MHMDHYGPLGPHDDHLLERVLSNVYSVLKPLGNMIKGSKMFKMVLVIFGNTRVLTKEGRKSSDIVRKSFRGFQKGLGVARN